MDLSAFKAAYADAPTYLGACAVWDAHGEELKVLRKTDPHSYQSLVMWCRKNAKHKISEAC